MKMGTTRHTRKNALCTVTPGLAARQLNLSDAKALVLPALLLIVAVTLAYMNSLSSPFIFDDLESITGNKYIRTLWPLSDMLLNAPPGTASDGRPVVSLSLAINYALGGLNVYGYHLFNIAVHLASTFVLWGVLRRTFMNTPLNARFGKSAPFLAFAIALIWTVHPLLTESVTYVSTRTELLMGLFYLLTLYCAILAWQSNHARFWSVLAVLSCAIGMGCKEAMLSAPLMVLLYDVTLVSSSLRDALRRHLKLYVGLAARLAQPVRSTHAELRPGPGDYFARLSSHASRHYRLVSSVMFLASPAGDFVSGLATGAKLYRDPAPGTLYRSTLGTDRVGSLVSARNRSFGCVVFHDLSADIEFHSDHHRNRSRAPHVFATGGRDYRYGCRHL